MSKAKSAKMKDDAKRELKPKLRFPEFEQLGDWDTETLSQLASRVTDRNAGGEHTRVLTNSAEHGILDQRDFFEKDIANQGNLENYFVVEEGDYVYNPRVSTFAPVGPMSKNKHGTGVMSPLYTVFRFENSSNDFYEHYFKTTKWHTYLRRVSNMGARHDRMSITNDDLMEMPLPFPDPKEQQKIADCLSSLDELIAAHSRKLDALKAHKKGLMQQLFPRESEPLPRLRFPEFIDAPKWVEQKLGDLVSIKSGYSPSKYKLSDSGPFPFVKVEDLNNCDKYQQTSRQYCHDGSDSIPLHSLVFPKRGAAIHLNKLRINAVEILMDTNLMAITPNSSIQSEFLFYAISNIGLSKIADTSTIPQINNKHIIPFKVFAPSKPEQEKIASTLCTIEDLVTTQTAKLDFLDEHKKGLMQKLFPSLEDRNA